MSFINKLSFIEKRHENDDVYTFFFRKPANLKHKAGQHGLFVLPGLYRPHPFSLSSAPEEEHVTFTTHVGTGSKFKQKLMNMDEKSSIILLGPILNFTLNDITKRYVFLAQGIGVTPFRSMLASTQASSPSVETTLIHVGSKGHSFKEFTKEHATNTYYPANANEFAEHVGTIDIDQLFYLSGSPKFVKATKKLLLNRGVAARNIKSDSFLGY